MQEERKTGRQLACALTLFVLLGSGAVCPAQTPDSAGEGEAARSTPRRALHGYLVASRADHYAAASEYLDLRALTPEERETRGPALARQLKIVLDRTLWVDVDALSDSPDGDPDDGLPADRERVGSIESRRGPVDVLLQHTRTAGGAAQWKIASSTVARVPELYAEFGYGALGQWLPAPFFELSLLEIQLWQWLALGGLILLAFAASWLILALGLGLTRAIALRTGHPLVEQLLGLAAKPARLGLAVAIFSAALPLLALSVPAQAFFSAVATILTVVAVTWFAFRAIDLALAWLSEHLTARGQSRTVAILPPGGRVAKSLLGVLALLLMLQNLGINVTAVLAGLGVGGIAVALAAQRTLENLFGGITLITDQPVRVGDFCRFSGKVGTVEDIGLRSTRVRTLDRTLITIPNADFSRLELENFAQRDRIWYNPRIGLRYETTPDQIRYVLVEIRRMLYAHPRVVPDPARIRFVQFGAYSLDLDVFAYVDTRDYGEFLEIAEDLNLRIMDIVAEAGSGFAFPSQTTYVEKGEGLDRERAQAAEAQVARWRSERQLYLPGFPPQEIERLHSTLDYPPHGSPHRDGP